VLQGALLLQPVIQTLPRRRRLVLDSRRSVSSPRACACSPQAALKLSGFPEINYYSAAVTPKSWLWTACIGTQMGA